VENCSPAPEIERTIFYTAEGDSSVDLGVLRAGAEAMLERAWLEGAWGIAWGLSACGPRLERRQAEVKSTNPLAKGGARGPGPLVAGAAARPAFIPFGLPPSAFARPRTAVSPRSSPRRAGCYNSEL